MTQLHTGFFCSLMIALAFLQSASVSQGASKVPGLEVPDKVEGPADDWIVVTAVTEGKVVRWVSMDPALKVFPTELLKDSKSIVVHARQPGSYRLIAYTSIADQPTLPAYCTVVVGGTSPTPPDPGPPPGPMPRVMSEGWLLVVEETADATAARGPFFTDKDLAAWLKARPYIKTKIVDKDVLDPNTNDTPASLKPWFAKMRDQSGKFVDLPQLLIIDQDGAIRHQSKVPATPAALLAILKTLPLKPQLP